MNNLGFYKKSIFLIILTIIGFLIILKFALNTIKSEAINVINSKKFEIFLFNQFNNKLQNFADKKMTEEEYKFYKENLKKIYIKYKPIFEEIKKETE